ncbi:unnamed protein product [Alopecurus aequalis]
MSPIRSHGDRQEKDFALIKREMLCPLTPRRKNLHLATVCKRTNCPCLPVALPAESPSAIETCHANIEWWESVLNWLQDKLRMIDESLGKDPEDLVVLCSRPENMTLTDGSVYHHPVPSQIIPRKKMLVPDGSAPLRGEEVQGFWKLFREQQRELKTCIVDISFYGPNCLPDIKTPSLKDMGTIKEFFSAHQKYMVKHFDHLIYLQDIIQNHLIPQVRSKTRELRQELKLLQNPDLKMRELLYFSDMDTEEDPVDYPAPETEEDYPDQSDEEDEGTKMMGQLILEGIVCF